MMSISCRKIPLCRSLLGTSGATIGKLTGGDKRKELGRRVTRAHSAVRNCANAQLVMALTSGFSASFGRLTRKYVSFVASSTEKILTSAPERNHDSHNTDGTNATPMPRSAARTTANIVSSSITFLGSGVSRPTSSAQDVHANGRVLCTISAICRKTSLPRRATVGACSFEQTAVSDNENNLEGFKPWGTWSDSRMDTSAVAG